MALIQAPRRIGNWRGEMRRVLRERDYDFCDDGPLPTLPAFDVSTVSCTGTTELLQSGLESSSCDHEGQQIDNTLDDHDSFWSSIGTGPGDDEHLLYRLKFPLCRLTHVDIMVYRALFQFGEPIYPPRQVSFYIGTSCKQLWPVPGCFRVAPLDAWQRFPLPTCAPLGNLLLVYMHGKYQTQWNDRRFYIALRQVKAFGEPVAGSQLERFRRHMRDCPALSLPEGSQLPASLMLRQQHPADAEERLGSSTSATSIPALLPWDQSEAAGQNSRAGELQLEHRKAELARLAAEQGFAGCLFSGGRLVSIAHR